MISTAKYELTVADSEGTLDGYPVMVDAAKGYYDVRDLQPETVYFVTVRSRSKTSDSLIVTTAALMPIVDFLFDGDLYFSTIAGEPSEVAEILVHIENIDTDVNISINKPLSYRSTVRRGSSLSQSPRRKPHIYATQQCHCRNIRKHPHRQSRRLYKRQQHRERYRRPQRPDSSRTSRPPRHRHLHIAQAHIMVLPQFGISTM